MPGETVVISASRIIPFVSSLKAAMISDNFRNIPVFPSPKDLLQNSNEIFLRPNIVKGSYTDVEHYLDIQFRLFREDCVRPLREAIASYGDGLRTNIRLFTDVRIRRKRLLGKRPPRIVHEVTFNPKRHEDIDWEDGKLLKFGSLLCLSRDHFQKTLLLGVVADGRPEKLRQGKVLVDFETPEMIDVLSGLHRYVMLESDAYFEAYRYNLAALQERDASNFPLREYIVEVRNGVKPPPYLTTSTRYDFTPLLVDPEISKETFQNTLVQDCSSWPSAEALGMDPSQLTALQTALTHDLAIIQGPPGTGKTFVGLNIIKLLLHNNAPRPILIVCYTNHALDQFLEGVLLLTRSVARLGTRCRSRIVKEHMVRSQMASLFGIRITVYNASVIGMTTTGAAKRRALLRQLRPKIVLMEEAAEVLEAHAFVAINEHTQHFVLIGDHRQLRPRPAVYALDREYQMGISLFERLVSNGLPYCTLRLQHRMRPCISRLLVPYIYETLDDHSSVSSYEHVRGMREDMFFVSHDFKETIDDTRNSRANQHEALFLVELCRYLMLQGYRAEQVTILATYNAQIQVLEKLRKEDPPLEAVKVTTVDNYQGEENDIILLSLVRSNTEGSIGFLKTENRVCVALSRARKGLYCIGNFELLQKHSALWRNIVSELNAQNAIGPNLNLKCRSHGSIQEVTLPSQFERMITGGGCGSTCQEKLECGHICKRLCHADDREHLAKISCLECRIQKIVRESLVEAIQRLTINDCKTQ